MTKAEILSKVLAQVTGKSEVEVGSLLTELCAANPKIAQGFSVDVPEAEAQEQISKMVAEGPGIMVSLMRGYQDVACHESKTVH